MQLMSVSAAARHLGYKSRSQLYKLMNDGWLDAHVHLRCLVGSACFTLMDYRRLCRAYFSGASIVSFLGIASPYKISITLNNNSVYAALRCSMGVKSHPIGD